MKRPPVFAAPAFFIGLAPVVLAVFWFARNFVLFAYYEETVAVLDGGWFAGILHGSDWKLSNPRVLGDNAQSYFHTHVVPLFIPLTYASRLLPMEPGEYMAAFLGAAFALYAALIFIAANHFLAQKSPPLRPAITAAIAAPAAFLLALNGVSAEILHYPHFEVWIPILVCAFLLALAMEKKKIAVAILIPLLAVREDAGFHLATSLMTIALFRQFPISKNPNARKKQLLAQKELLLWSAVAILYSLVAINIGGVPAPRPNVFDQRILSRVVSVLTRGDWAPALIVVAAWAAYARKPAMLIGFAALIPWTAFNILHERPLSGHMATYYGFPVLTAFFWPFVAEHFFPNPNPNPKESPRGKRREKESRARIESVPAAVFAALFAASSLLFRPGNVVFYDDMRVPKVGLTNLFAEGAAPTPKIARQNIRKLRDFFAARAEELNIVVADGFASLHPHDVPAERLLYRGPLKLEQDDAGILIAHTTWMQLFVKSVFAARAAFGLNRAYRVRDSGVDERAFFLFSKTPLCDPSGKCINDLPLEETRLGPSYYDLAAREISRDSFYFPAPTIAAPDAATANDIITAENSGLAAELQNLPLPPGRTALFLEYAHDVESGPLPKFEITWRDGDISADLPAVGYEHISAARMMVNLPERREVTARVIHNGGGTLRVFGLAARAPEESAQ